MQWDLDSGAVELCYVCKGHARSVEGLSVNPDCTSFASVSWDKMLKVWSLTESSGEEEDQEGSSKKRRLQGKSTTKVGYPATLQLHRSRLVAMIGAPSLRHYVITDCVTCIPTSKLRHQLSLCRATLNQ